MASNSWYLLSRSSNSLLLPVLLVDARLQLLLVLLAQHQWNAKVLLEVVAVELLAVTSWLLVILKHQYLTQYCRRSAYY